MDDHPRRREIEAKGLTFTVWELGDGEPVVFLHGFPQTTRAWLPVMGALASEGFRCIGIDQRGYSEGARPAGVDRYRYEDLVGDVIGISEVLGLESFHVAGHDWGAFTAWALVSVAPQLVRTLTAISVPHYLAFARASWEGGEEGVYRQWMAACMAPGAVAETMIADHDFAGLRVTLPDTSGGDLAYYRELFSDPAALTGAVNWWRACRGHRRALEDPTFPFPPVSTPTLFIWGNRDPYVSRLAVDLAEPLMIGPYRFVELDAGHWLMEERTEDVAGNMLALLREHSP